MAMIKLKHSSKCELYNFNNQTYRQFVNFLYKLNSFARDEQWIELVTLDSIINPQISKFFVKIISSIKKDFSIENLNKNILLIRNKIDQLIKIIDFGNLDIDEKYFYERELYCYFGLIEIIVEGSIVTDYLKEELECRYGQNFLSKLSEIDKENPSELNAILTKNPRKYEKSDVIIQLYLFLKSWQDDQNIYHKKIIINRHHKLRDEFERYAIRKFPYLSKFKKQVLYALYMLNICPIINMETLVKFSHSYVFNKISAVIGGKALGLTKLMANKIKIPQSFVIPVGSAENSLYTEEIDNLPNISYAVRSSATLEDGNKYSFAGLFDTDLNVEKNKILDSISRVLHSVNNKRVCAYIKRFKIGQPYMSIVLQEYYSPEYSGVWIGSDKKSGHLEYVGGSGEKLVSGKVTPCYEFWGIKPQKITLKSKRGSVGRYLMNLQNTMGNVSDFEFCIKNGNLILLQYRPVTKTIFRCETDKKETNDVIRGIPVSSGVCEGVPIFVTAKPYSKKFLKGKILLADCTDPEWVPVLMDVAGIITAEGGLLCHAAIIARELNVPCICGVGYNNIDILAKTKLVKMNGTTGIVEIFKRN